MADNTEAADVASWWKRLKAAPAYVVEKAKELWTSGKLKELAYSHTRTLVVFITLLDTIGRYLPPPGDQAATLLSGLCKCVHGAQVNNTNLEKLRDRCLDLLDLVLDLGGIGAFISTCRSSSELPKLSKEFTSIMDRFVACIKEVYAYCEHYTKAGILADLRGFSLYSGHKEDYEELVTELRNLRDDATLALSVDHNRMLQEAKDKGGANERIQANLEKIQARLAEDIPFKMDEKLEEYMARLKVRDYSILLHQPHLKALWSKYFTHEQAVRWGVWWTVFPGKLALDKTLDEAAREKLVGLLKDKDSKDAFKRAVEKEDTIYISIDELCLSFPDDSPLLPTVGALLCKGKNLVREDKDRTELAMAEAGHKLARVRQENAPQAPYAQTEQGRPKGSPVQGGAQLFLSYRVPETGRKRHGGDRTVPQLKSALEAHGYSVFMGESDIEGGASWVQTIQVAITDCQVFIPVCSKTYGDTKWTLRELHAADEANKEILPLWHSGDYPPKPVSMYLGNVQRLPRGNQPLVQANFQSLVSDLVAAVKKAGCLPRNPPGPSNQGLQGLTLDQGRKRI